MYILSNLYIVLLSYANGVNGMGKPGNNNKLHHVAQGKYLGGSSSINFLAYFRPSCEDVDNWERLGGKEWNWETPRPYYLKSEGVPQSIAMQGCQDTFSLFPRSHGEGPNALAFPTWRFPFEVSLLRALEEMEGKARPVDPGGGDHVGFHGTWATVDWPLTYADASILITQCVCSNVTSIANHEYPTATHHLPIPSQHRTHQTSR
jgi:hypothetical protein